MSARKKKPNPHPGWVQRRQAALNQRAGRDVYFKRRDAFLNRVREHDALWRILISRYGLDPGHARSIVLSAESSPVKVPFREKRGRPPTGYELFEAVEDVRRYFGGTLPTGAGFWQSFTLQWNAEHFEKHPEQMYLTTPAGRPDWRSLQSVYRISARSLQRKARSILREHATKCAACRSAANSPPREVSDWPLGLPEWLARYTKKRQPA